MKIVLPNFSDKKELFRFIVANKADIIEMKKSASKVCDSVIMSEADDIRPGVTIKSAIGKDVSRDTDDSISRTICGNTYNWMDSHLDMHLNGLFGKSISDRKGRIWHLHDHDFAITAKVGVPINIYEKYIDWEDLGVKKSGQTQSLFMDSVIKKSLNARIFDEYKSGEINQHSVKMEYVKMFVCVNDEEYKEEFQNWKDYYPLMGNPEKADNTGYFFAIKEARVKEISCVLEGSNELTPTMEVKDTVKQPPLGTESQPSQFDIKQLLNIF